MPKTPYFSRFSGATKLAREMKKLRDKEDGPRHLSDGSYWWGVVTSVMTVEHWDWLCEPNIVPEKNKIRGMTIHA